MEAHPGELFTDEDAEELDSAEGESEPIERPVPIATAERDQLACANEERHDWLARDRTPDRTVIRVGYRRRSDFEAGTTDPDATLMVVKNVAGFERTRTTLLGMAGPSAQAQPGHVYAASGGWGRA